MVLGEADDAVDRRTAEEEAEARRFGILGDAKQRALLDRGVPAAVGDAVEGLGQRAERVAARHEVGGGEVGAAARQDEQVGHEAAGRLQGELLDDRAHRAVAGEDGDVALAPGHDPRDRGGDVGGLLDGEDFRAAAARERSRPIGEAAGGAKAARVDEQAGGGRRRVGRGRRRRGPGSGDDQGRAEPGDHLRMADCVRDVVRADRHSSPTAAAKLARLKAR